MESAFADFNHLLFCNSQLFHKSIRLDVSADPIQKFLRPVIHLFFVQHAARRILVSKKNVCRHIQKGYKVKLLVNCTDAAVKASFGVFNATSSVNQN